jgi:hypothetical protein
MGENMNSENLEPGASRSIFVTVVAWIFIVLAGFATFMAVLQNIMINTTFPVDQMLSAMEQARAKEIPPFVEYMLKHFRRFLFAFLCMSATTFVSAIGLLKSKNWARVVFICLMVLGIVRNIGGLLVQQSFFSLTAQIPVNAPEDFRAHFESMARVMTIFSVRIWPSFRGSSGLEPCDVPKVRLRSEPLWLPGGTTISTISRRRLVHNAG